MCAPLCQTSAHVCSGKCQAESISSEMLTFMASHQQFFKLYYINQLTNAYFVISLTVRPSDQRRPNIALHYLQFFNQIQFASTPSIQPIGDRSHHFARPWSPPNPLKTMTQCLHVLVSLISPISRSPIISYSTPTLISIPNFWQLFFSIY